LSIFYSSQSSCHDLVDTFASSSYQPWNGQLWRKWWGFGYEDLERQMVLDLTHFKHRAHFKAYGSKHCCQGVLTPIFTRKHFRTPCVGAKGSSYVYLSNLPAFS
jgi:hypothetical protein